LVDSLTAEQAEAAANTSYAYWLHHHHTQTRYSEQPESSSNDDDNNNNKNDELRIKFAMIEARRHYVGEKKNFVKALEALTETINFRMEKRIDLLRLIGETSAITDAKYNDEEREILERYRRYVQEELKRQLTVVGGCDRLNRAVIIRWGRNTPKYDPEGFLIGLMYTCERAVAATEIRSCGQEEKIVAFLDLAHYDSCNSPPTSLFRTMGYSLQRYYPERNDAVVMFDPPFWLRAVYRIISVFLDPVTRNKVLIISGEAAKETTLKERIDTEHALPVLLDDGSLSSDIDVHKYISEVPFHLGYGLKD
jgi:CRAL/TRIO domain